ncbi:hypothetical protein pb186bvf_009229 [Paramecium bursaria]
MQQQQQEHIEMMPIRLITKNVSQIKPSIRNMIFLCQIYTACFDKYQFSLAENPSGNFIYNKKKLSQCISLSSLKPVLTLIYFMQ